MEKTTNNRFRQALAISIGIVLCTLILDRLVPEGIFLDGVTYASISRNLAIGKGSMWYLYYRGDWAFTEHPPLFFGIQSIFFKVLGDHYFTEKIYCFVLWVLTILVLKRFWTAFKPADETTDTFILPLLMWCLAPTVTWGYTNNILDSTMAIWDLLAVWFLFIACSKSSWQHFIAGGLLVFAASFTKGPVGIFPLAVPGLYWLVYENKSFASFGHALVRTFVVLVILAGCYYLLYQFREPRWMLDSYLHQQLLAALEGRRELTGNGAGRLAILADLVIQLLPAVAIAAVLFIIKKAVKGSAQTQANSKNILFLLLMGICGSLPIMLSVKQRTFYLLPALPFYVLAIALLIYPWFVSVTNKPRMKTAAFRRFNITAIIVGLALLVYLGTKVGQVGRDHELIANMKYLGTQFPPGQTFGICAEANEDYEFLAYLERYNRMEVNPVFYCAEYVLIDKQRCNNDVIPFVSAIGFKKQKFGLDRYEIYKRQFPLHFDFTLLHPVFRIRDI